MAEKRITLVIYGADRDLWKGGALRLGVTAVESDNTSKQVTVQKLAANTSSVLVNLNAEFDRQQAYLFVLTAPRHRDAWYAITHETFLRDEGGKKIEREDVILRMLLVPNKTRPNDTAQAYDRLLEAGSAFVTKPGLSRETYNGLKPHATMALLNIEAKLRSTRIDGTPLLAYVQGIRQVEVDRVYLYMAAEAKGLIRETGDFASAPGHEAKPPLPEHPHSWKHKAFPTGNLQLSFAKDPEIIDGVPAHSVDVDIDLERGLRHVVEWLDNNVFVVNKTDQTRVYALLYGQGITPYYTLKPL